MKHLKWITIIIVITIVLIKLFVPPLWTWTIPESINESKRTGAFLWEYEISRIDTLEPNYNFPKFKNIWMTKIEVVRRNKIGIIHLVADHSSDNHIVIEKGKNDANDLGYLFVMNEVIVCELAQHEDMDNTNYYHEIAVKELGGYQAKIMVQDTTIRNHTITDTVYYNIYRIPRPYSYVERTPLFRMELVAKPDKN